MLVKIKRSEYNKVHIGMAFLGAIIPAIAAFFFLYSRYDNLISLFFNVFFLIYVPAFTFIFSKRVEKFQKIRPIFTVSPVLFRFIAGVFLTALICRPFVNEYTVFVELILYYLAGPLLMFLDFKKK